MNEPTEKSRHGNELDSVPIPDEFADYFLALPDEPAESAAAAHTESVPPVASPPTEPAPSLATPILPIEEPVAPVAEPAAPPPSPAAPPPPDDHEATDNPDLVEAKNLDELFALIGSDKIDPQVSRNLEMVRNIWSLALDQSATHPFSLKNAEGKSAEERLLFFKEIARVLRPALGINKSGDLVEVFGIRGFAPRTLDIIYSEIIKPTQEKAAAMGCFTLSPEIGSKLDLNNRLFGSLPAVTVESKNTEDLTRDLEVYVVRTPGVLFEDGNIGRVLQQAEVGVYSASAVGNGDNDITMPSIQNGAEFEKLGNDGIRIDYGDEGHFDIKKGKTIFIDTGQPEKTPLVVESVKEPGRLDNEGVLTVTTSNKGDIALPLAVWKEFLDIEENKKEK